MLFSETVMTTRHVVRRESLREKIVDLAVAGEIVPGEVTSEKELSAKLDSPPLTLIREALALLAVEGLFQEVPRKGIALREISHSEIERSVAARPRLECRAVLDLAGLPDRENRLQDAVKAIRDALGALMNSAVFGKASAQFHVALVAAAGHRSAAFSLRISLDRLRIYEAIQGRMLSQSLQRSSVGSDRVGLPLTFGRLQDRVQILGENQAILEAVERGEPNEAVDALMQHITKSGDRLAPAETTQALDSNSEALVNVAGYFSKYHVHKTPKFAENVLEAWLREAKSVSLVDQHAVESVIAAVGKAFSPDFGVARRRLMKLLG
jgi:DNA-binding GntR family transcriptional regulator